MIKSKLMASLRHFAAAVSIAVVGIACLPSSASAATIGVYELMNLDGYKCMTVNGGNVDTVQPIIQLDCNSGSWLYQQFRFDSSTTLGTYVIHPKSAMHRCLGMAYNIQTNGILLQQQTCTGSNTQKFYLNYRYHDDFYKANVETLQNYGTSFCMQNDSSWDNYHMITQWSCDSSQLKFNWAVRKLANS